MKKLAIIGASYLQLPLIKKAKEMQLETHVFAWEANDVGEKVADYFYPISIVEKEEICEKCRKIGIDGVCSIGSDLAVITVNYIADQMGLIGNSMQSTMLSTNKHLMRQCFFQNNDPSPRSILIRQGEDVSKIEIEYPLIVKPTDRSGSRGITKLHNPDGLQEAIDKAICCGFEGNVLIEEYVSGQEYSVEYISHKGHHMFLALTLKYTTGEPHYIEIGHLEPAPVSNEMLDKIKRVVEHALSSIGIMNGASHTEVKVNENGEIKIIEIGGRMGGDLIGSDLVRLSTGIDYVRAVIQISLGMKPTLEKKKASSAAIRYITSKEDLELLKEIKQIHPSYIVREHIDPVLITEVTDSSKRGGWFIMCDQNGSNISKYMPDADRLL